MKVKLDENISRQVRAVLEAAGADVDTVDDEGLAGTDDVVVGRAATDDGRLLITLDRGFGDVVRYPPGSHEGIVVLRVDDQSAGAVCAAVGQLISIVDLDDLRGCVAVYRAGSLRVRRPPVEGQAP